MEVVMEKKTASFSVMVYLAGDNNLTECLFVHSLRNPPDVFLTTRDAKDARRNNETQDYFRSRRRIKIS